MVSLSPERRFVMQRDRAPGERPATNRARRQTVGFLLMPSFPLLSFASALEPLRMANRQRGQEALRWQLLSLDGAVVTSSSGVEVRPHAALAEARGLDLLLVIAGAGIEGYRDRAGLARVRHAARQARAIGAVTLGSYVLARAGLLAGYRCTIHWEYLEAFREEFPGLEVTPEVFEIDRDRLTCSGGTAALDLMLAYIGREHGTTLATECADLLMHERIRDHFDRQRMPLRARIGASHPKLLAVIELMEASTEEVLSRTELARRVGLSGRQLERLFQKYLGTTPRQYYLDHRLARARSLLRQTTLPVIEIAVACGFSTASHFAKSYRERYGITPREERAGGQTPAATEARRDALLADADS